MSTLTRAGALSEMLTAYRCSPSSGWRNTISCGPIGSDRLPIGVSPVFSPSIHTSAQGSAFTDAVPFGHSMRTGATFPAGTWTTAVARYPSASLTISS